MSNEIQTTQLKILILKLIKDVRWGSLTIIKQDDLIIQLETRERIILREKAVMSGGVTDGRRKNGEKPC
jgi:hypothetical protein